MPPSTVGKVFTYNRHNLHNDCVLYIVDIEEVTTKLKEYLDDYLGELTFGRKNMELWRVKRDILQFLSTKRGSTQESGSIAEFFVDLFLHHRGLKPQFLIDNLEENAVKKGFDGYYVDDAAVEWICESKSGSLSTKKMTHVRKVKEAYKDLKNKLAGKTNNNPWQNAVRHAKQADAEATLQERLQKVSDNYNDKNFLYINDCHIIPSATIYIDGPWKTFDVDEISLEIEATIEDFECKGLRVLCITKQSMDVFYKYLNS